MITWITLSILSAVVGSTFYEWWEDTKMGTWFNRKFDNTLDWAAKRYHIDSLKKEEKNFNKLPERVKEAVLYYEKIQNDNK